MTTIPNPMDSQRDELAVARIQRDFLQDQLNEIATALYVRATIQCENDVVGGVNELLDSWEEMYAEKVEGLRVQSEQRLNELHDQLKAHKTSSVHSDELRKYFEGKNGE